MTVWFGASWGAFCDQAPHVATPVGARCAYCHELILWTDAGVGLPIFHSEGPPRQGYHHLECWMRLLKGSVAHQLGACACAGVHDEDDVDPPEVSLRDEARAAAALAMFPPPPKEGADDE
jgi:hypothetical protein